MDSPPPSVSSPRLFRSIDHLLRWLAKVWVPLGGATVALGALYWLEFLKIYAIPASFASPAALTSLPALAAVLCAAIWVLGIFMLIPSFVLWIPLNERGQTLLDANTAWLSDRSSNGRSTRWDLFHRWNTLNGVMIVLWIAAIAIPAGFPDLSALLITVLVLAVFYLIAMLMLRPIYWKLDDSKKTYALFALLLSAAVVVQSLTTFWIIYIASQTVTEVSTIAIAGHVAFSLMAAIALGAIQHVSARWVRKGWYPNLPKHAVLVSLTLLGAPLLVPPVGGRLASIAFRVSGSDGKPCVVLLPTDDRSFAAWRDILDPKHPWQSLPLNFAMHLDDVYYVKTGQQAPTHVIPASQVREIRGCPVKAG